MAFAEGGALEPDGPVAREIAGLTWLMVVLGLIAFAVFAVVLTVGLLRGRSSTAVPELRRSNRFITVLGVVFPAAVLAVVMGFTVETMRDIPNTAPEGALTIEVIGHRWWYEVRYPDHGITTANELHLPLDRPVEFRLTSVDVIHSFWIPALGGKLDLLPGDENTLVLEADEPGVHHAQCAEFCGLQHAKMALVAVVEPVEEFDRWVRREARAASTPQTPGARRGAEVFRTAGCGQCHTVDGAGSAGEGPDLTHVASRRTLAAGTLPNTRANLARWLTDPDSVKEGSGMPAADLDGAELEAILDYLESLR